MKIQHKQYKPQAAHPSLLDVIKILIYDVHSTGNIPIHKADFNNTHTLICGPNNFVHETFPLFNATAK